MPGLSIGIMSATQGDYRQAQMLLDITQGTRVSYSAYSPSHPPVLSLAGSQVSPWHKVLARAQSAPQILEPGLLASQIPGGAGYAAISGSAGEDGTIAADRAGGIAAVSIGSPATLPARVAALEERERLVVVDLPGGHPGEVDLRSLIARRSPGELEIVIGRPPDLPGNELVWVGVAGMGASGTLTSQTTNERGLLTAIDVGPTILRHLHLAVPSAMQGRPLELDGHLEAGHLRSLKQRLESIYARRLPALGSLLGAWALLLLVALLSKPSPSVYAMRSKVLRVGALAMLWTPVAVLIGAALEPGPALEYTILVVSCFALGALTDTAIGWPRAPIAPASVAIVALTVDALAGTQLLMRSLLGPNPAYGARFYGFGNELKPALAVLLLAAVASALHPATRSRKAAITMALCGALLAAIEGSAKIGAGVGSVILVSAGTAVATVMLLPGALTRRRALIALLCPVLALVALAGLDLATAHGTGHFAGSALDVRSAGDLRDIIVRRYGAAWQELQSGAMPVASTLALLAGVVGVLARRRLLAPVGSDPAWLAACGGGLTAGVMGTLVEDSGPVLLVVAVFGLICVLAYLWGRPTGVPAK